MKERLTQVLAVFSLTFFGCLLWVPVKLCFVLSNSFANWLINLIL